MHYRNIINFIGLYFLSALSATALADTYRVPAAILNSMDLDRAIDIVVAEKGQDWIQKPAEVCAIFHNGKVQMIENGVRLDRLQGMEIQNHVAFENGEVVQKPSLRMLSMVYSYPPIPAGTCKVTFTGITPDKAATLGAAFQRIASTPKSRLDNKFHELFYIDPNSMSPAEKFLETKAEFDESRNLLDNYINSLSVDTAVGRMISPVFSPGVGSRIVRKTETFAQGKKGSDQVLTVAINAVRGNTWQYTSTTEMNLYIGEEMNTYTTPTECRTSDPTILQYGGTADCTNDNNARTKETTLRESGNASFFPLDTSKPQSHFREYTHETITPGNAESFKMQGRNYRACFPEVEETITVAAGTFNTVRLVCGSLYASESDNFNIKTKTLIKGINTIWFDIKTGVVVKSEGLSRQATGGNRGESTSELVELSGF